MGRMSPEETSVPTLRTRVSIPVNRFMRSRIPYGSAGKAAPLRRVAVRNPVRGATYGEAFSMEAALPLRPPSVRTAGDRVAVDGLVVDDPVAVRLVHEREE